MHNGSASRVGQRPGVSAPVAPSATTPSSAPASSAPTRAPAKTVVAFLGDDYTAAVGASEAARGFVALLSKRLHLRGHRFGVPGGGYAKLSGDGRTYADRVDDVVAARPDVVVVTGGRNDTPDDPTTMATQVTDLFAALHKRLPDAVLVAVAPFWGDSDHPSELDAVASAVEAGVLAVDGRYLDVPDPLHGIRNGWPMAPTPTTSATQLSRRLSPRSSRRSSRVAEPTGSVQRSRPPMLPCNS